VGIEPDIVVEPARIETVGEGRDRREADLRGALDRRGSEAEPAPAATEGQPATDPKAQDYQLSRALDLVRGLSLFSGRGTTTVR
jgi:carboxyl-terminal processing protease